MSTFTKHCNSILRHVCNSLSVVWNYNMCTFYKKRLFINLIAVKKTELQGYSEILHYKIKTSPTIIFKSQYYYKTL